MFIIPYNIVVFFFFGLVEFASRHIVSYYFGLGLLYHPASIYSAVGVSSWDVCEGEIGHPLAV